MADSHFKECEEWRTVSAFPMYEVSSYGNIRHKNVRKTKNLKPNSNGYLRAAIEVKGKSYHPLMNRLVCEAFNGPPPTPKHTAAHENGNRQDNYYKNLSWKTRKENYQDQIRHGTSKQGKGNHMAKLTEDDVWAIRFSFRTPRELAERHGVSRSCIQAIQSGKLWSHLWEYNSDQPFERMSDYF